MEDPHRRLDKASEEARRAIESDPALRALFPLVSPPEGMEGVLPDDSEWTAQHYKQRSENPMTLYLAECYTRNPQNPTETGFDIKFAWVQATTPTEARAKVAARVPFFDVIIKMDERVHITPLELRGDKAYVIDVPGVFGGLPHPTLLRA